MASKKNDLTYAEASGELEEILNEIESGDADVDKLSEKVTRAAALIQLCRDKLASTEQQVKKVVEAMAESDEEEAEG